MILNVLLSPWMFIASLTLALYLTAIKRQQELMEIGVTGTRRVLEHYIIAILDKISITCAICTIMFYMFVHYVFK